MDPVAEVEMFNLCDSALQRLGMLTSELHFDEYTSLDLLLGVCLSFMLLLDGYDSSGRLAQDSWGNSLTVFDVRIETLAFEESASLRHFRTLVGKMYSDFQAGLLNYEPPMIYSLALMEDGTTEASKYPNLMLAKTRMQFGI